MLLISQQLFLETIGVVLIFLLWKISCWPFDSLPLQDPKESSPPIAASKVHGANSPFALWVQSFLHFLWRLHGSAFHNNFSDKPSVDLPWEEGSLWLFPKWVFTTRQVLKQYSCVCTTTIPILKLNSALFVFMFYFLCFYVYVLCYYVFMSWDLIPPMPFLL